ncbi:hypothetical protein [Kitasatospora fiedleri]|uniref:hypothetical protein n=1 Tax=Kitasatospora fiedleri TaxID=2991545 RepID=UPI00249B5531|nr:hypothetical protein [Kitasatospora fiedleri]
MSPPIVQLRGTRDTGSIVEPLQFIGIISNTPEVDSPTIWRDPENGDLLIQSYKASSEDLSRCKEVGSVPGHSTDVPDHETVIRLPEEMIKFIVDLAARLATHEDER